MARIPALILLALFLGGCPHAPQQEAPSQPYATREGLTVRLHPSEISFRVPQQWLE